MQSKSVDSELADDEGKTVLQEVGMIGLWVRTKRLARLDVILNLIILKAEDCGRPGRVVVLWSSCYDATAPITGLEENLVRREAVNFDV